MIFGESWLKDVYRRAVWGPGGSVAQALPPPWEHRLVRTMGRLSVHAAAGKRAQVSANMGRAFPSGVLPDGRPLSDGVADAFVSHFANQYIGFSFTACTSQTWPKYLAFRGLERLERARASGRGVVLCHPHMGPAQLPLHVLGLLDWPVTQVGGGRVTEVSLSKTGRWAAGVRASLESRMPVRLHDGKRYLRPLLRALQAGEVVMTAMDGTGGGEELGARIMCTVLGHSFPLPRGPAWLASRTGAALMPMSCFRNPGDGALYLAEIGDEIPVLGRRPQEVESAVQAMGSWLDQQIHAHPGDWLFWDGFRPGGLLP